jgi:tellurite resistance protein
VGLFDSLFGSVEASTKLTVPEAFAGVLMAASACDGHIAEDEVQGLVTTLIRMKLYQRFTDKQYNQMLNKLYGAIKKKGVDSMVDACADALPQPLRDTAFANAVDIVLADGVLEPDERAFVNRLQSKLSVEKQKAMEIVEIMVIKNKG